MDPTTTAPDGADVDQLMTSGLALARRLDDDGGPSLASLIEPFLDITYHLGLALHAADALDRADVVEYRREAGSLLAPYRSVVQHAVDRCVQRFTPAFQLDEWLLLCRRRSAFAFLQELSESTEFEVASSTIDLGALDQLIGNVGVDEGGLGPDEVPTAMPAEHWWWWYPESPPG